MGNATAVTATGKQQQEQHFLGKSFCVQLLLLLLYTYKIIIIKLAIIANVRLDSVMLL